MLAFCHTLSSCFLKTTLMGHSLHPKKGDSTDWLSFGETISYSLFWKLKLVLTDNRAIYSDNHHIYYTQMRISDVCLKDLKLKTALSDHSRYFPSKHEGLTSKQHWGIASCLMAWYHVASARRYLNHEPTSRRRHGVDSRGTVIPRRLLQMALSAKSADNMSLCSPWQACYGPCRA